MTAQALAAWLAKRSNAPKKVLTPIATRLGVPTNYLSAALFAGQLVYENQDVIVEYTSKGGVTVGEFLHARARQRYGEDHPLTRHLGENVDAISEAFEGTEEEARTFAEFYRQYRRVDREHRLRDELGPGVVAALADRLPDRDAVPGRDALPDPDDVPGSDRLPSADRLPGSDSIPDLPGPFGSDSDRDADDPVEIPVIDSN